MIRPLVAGAAVAVPGLAHAVLGAGLHAAQDFLSHSTWIDDPSRRDRTWFDLPCRERQGLDVTTGAYERPAPAGGHEHGRILLAGSVLPRRRATVDPHVDPAIRRLGLVVPRAVRRVEPGINLDSRWQAVLGVRARGVHDLDGPAAFRLALDLAVRTSNRLVGELDALLRHGAGTGPFWSAVRTDGWSSPRGRVAPWADPGQRPHRFLTVGADAADADGDRWWLRITARTAAGARRTVVRPVTGAAPPPALALRDRAWPRRGSPVTRVEVSAFRRGREPTVVDHDPVDLPADRRPATVALVPRRRRSVRLGRALWCGGAARGRPPS